MQNDNAERLEPSRSNVVSLFGANKVDSENESLLWYSVISKIRTEIENYQGTIYIPDLATVA